MPWVPRLAFAAALVHAASLAAGIAVIARNGAAQGQQLRLTVLGGSSKEEVACIAALGIMRDGCLDPVGTPPPAAATRSATSLTTTFPQPFAINGFYLVPETRGNCSGRPPARFVAEVSEVGATWARLGASSRRWTWAGFTVDDDRTDANSEPRISRQCAAAVEARANAHEFDLRPPLSWGAARVAAGTLQLAMVALMLACIAAGDELRGRHIAALVWAASAVIDAVAALVHVASGRAYGGIALVSAALAVQAAGFAVALARDERNLRLWCGTGGPMVLLVLVAHYEGRVELLLGSTLGLENRGLWESIFLTVVFLTASQQRQRSHRCAEDLVAEDRRRYVLIRVNQHSNTLRLFFLV